VYSVESSYFLRLRDDGGAPWYYETLAFLRDSGAFGSRLTGAGWGGCAVSLVPINILDSFLSSVRKSYYHKFDENALTDVVFATEPGDGAQVYVF